MVHIYNGIVVKSLKGKKCHLHQHGWVQRLNEVKSDRERQITRMWNLKI